MTYLAVIVATAFLELFFPVAVNTVTSSCPPAEEYKPYTLTCPTNNNDVVWRNDKGTNIAACDSTSCRPANPAISTATWTSSVSTFTFKTMSRTNKFYLQEYSCIQTNTDGTSSSHSQCRPGFLYARPDKPTCSSPLVSNTTLSLTCQTQKIFPQAGCQSNNQTSALHGTVTYINGTLNDMTTDYYQPQCTIELNLGSDIGPGIHQFKVLMYPDVPDGISFGAESDLTSDINLALPSASLSTSCSNNVNVTDNYIKEGATVTCQCNKAKDGNPPGWVEWVYKSKSNEHVSNTKDNTAILTITAELGGGEGEGEGPDFICRGASNLGQELPGVPFKKEIAFGPSSLYILKDDIGDLCPPNTSISLTVYCEIPINNVKPEPFFTVSINNPSPFSEINVTNTTHYRWKSEFALTTSGKHQVTCLATNSEFSTIQEQDVISVEIRGPPTSGPFIKDASEKVIDDGKTVSEIEGDNITCYVEGGYPPANVSLTCGSGNDTTVVTGSMKVSMNVSAYKDQTNCTCTVVHLATGCTYEKTSSFTFNDPYGSSGSQNGFETAVIVGVSVAGFFVIGLGILICCICIRRGKLSRYCENKKKGRERQRSSEKGRDSVEVIVPVEIYGSPVTVPKGTQGNTHSNPTDIVTPNPIYGSGMKEQESVGPNPLYGKGSEIGKKSQSVSMGTDYTAIVPTITSATAAPGNMKTKNKETGKLYEDVGNMSVPVSTSKPKAPNKPKHCYKTEQNQDHGQSAGSQPSALAVQPGNVSETYATVSKPLNSGLTPAKPKRPYSDTEPIFPDPATKPPIPDKSFASEEMKRDSTSSNVYANRGFVEDNDNN